MTLKLILIFITLTILAFIAEWMVVKIAYKNKLFDKPNERKIHLAKIPRLGGVVIFPIIVIGIVIVRFADLHLFKSLFSHTHLELLAIVASLAVVYFCGIADDLIGIRYRNKFVAQIFSGIVLCLCGVTINNLHGFLFIGQLPDALSWFFTILAVIYVSNAINFIDGIDGLAASLSIIALVYYALMFMSLSMKGLVVVCGFVCIALFALLTFNMFGKPEKNKVFMGDAGSLTLGVFVCICGILTLHHSGGSLLASKNPFIVATAPLFLPCFDVVRVVVYRLNHKSNIFEADKSHIHHKLLDLGLSQRKALFIILAVDLFMIAVASVSMSFLGANSIILLEMAIFTLVILLINRKLKQN